MKAGRDVLFVGEAYDARAGASGPMRNATFAMDAAGPGEAQMSPASVATGFAARVNFSAPGAWRLLVSANGTPFEFPLDVYPATDVHADSASLRYDLHYAGRQAKASLFFVEDATGALVKRDATVTARVERWENGSKLAEEIVALKPGGSKGDHLFEHTFTAEGTYRVRVASPQLGIGYGDLPPFEVGVLAAEAAAEEEPSRQTAAAWVVSLLAAALVASLARRR